MMSFKAYVCLLVCTLVCLRAGPSLALVCYETTDTFSSTVKADCAACLTNTISVFGESLLTTFLCDKFE